MSLFDFFFPEQAQAMHLRSIRGSLGKSTAPKASASRRSGPAPSSPKMTEDVAALQERVAALENDVGTLSLVAAALIRALGDKDIASRAELQEYMAELDLLDGARDGQVDIAALRALATSDSAGDT